MKKRDVSKLKVGDYIELRHNLGKGTITKIAMFESHGNYAPSIGRYPMIEFTEKVTGTSRWCTYLAIEVWPDPLINQQGKEQ